MSNGGFSDAYSDIDQPDKIDAKIPNKTKTALPLIKTLKVLSLSLGLTHTLFPRSLYTAILLNLIHRLSAVLVHENGMVTSLTDQ